MNYKIKTKVEGDILVVSVVLPKLEKDEKTYKVDAGTLLTELREKHSIITIVENETLRASHDKEIAGEYKYKIEPPKKVKRKTSRKRTTTVTDDDDKSDE